MHPSRQSSFLTCSTIIIALVILFGIKWSSATTAQNSDVVAWQVRVIDAEHVGSRNPAGLAFSARSDAFHVVSAHASSQSTLRSTDIVTMNSSEDQVGSAKIEAVVTDPINIAFDSQGNRLLILNSSANQLIEVLERPDGKLDASNLVRHDVRHFELRQPQGIAVDPATGQLFILDTAQPEIVRVDVNGEEGFDDASISRVDLQELGLDNVGGLAMDPNSGHLYLLSGSVQELYEFTQSGRMVATYDVSGIALHNPQAMVFAPSGDPTDDPGELNLYVADGETYIPKSQSSKDGDIGNSVESAGSIVEISLVPAAQNDLQVAATLVNTIDTSAFSPPSPDPAGITYYAANDHLFISDSEVNELVPPEYPPLFAGANLFETTLTGTLVYTGTTTTWLSPGPTNEPTGVTYNTNNGHFYFSDDDKDEVFELVDPGVDTLYGTADDVITSFDTRDFGSEDPEGIAYWRDGSGNDHLFIIDGVGREVYHVEPGPNGLFDGVDDEVSNFDVAQISTGLHNPEGIEANPDSGTLFIIDQTDVVIETSTDGVLLRVVDISAAEGVNPAGIAYGPSSEVGDSGKNFYIVDRGLDNDPYPFENDGKVYEMSVDLPPVIVFTSPSSSLTEAATTVTIDVTLFYTSAQTITVDYATSDGTATAGSDYTATTGTLTFLPGETKKSFTVSILEDTIDELDETLNLTLSNASGAGAVVGSTDSITLEILDDDDPPTVQFASTSYSEDEDAGSATIDVTLSAQSGLSVTVEYNTSDIDAVAGVDYVATSGTLTFLPSQTSKSLIVPITDDVLDEADEALGLALSGANNATLSEPDSAELTIVDDDDAPEVRFSSSSYNASEGVGAATITVTLSAVSGQAVTVQYQTEDDTAQAGSDYTAISGTLNLAAGTTSKTFSVPISEDALDEDDESLDLSLSNPGNAVPGTPVLATLNIADNDPLPKFQFSAANYSVDEAGDSALITVFLNPVSGRSTSVNYSTSDDTATAGSDYTATSGTLNFDPGESSKTFNVPILDDALDEVDETISLTLSTPFNAELAASHNASLKIVDDDLKPIVHFSSSTYSVAETDGTATITATLSTVSAKTITVDYDTSDGTAVAGSDYTTASGTLTFDPGESSKSFTVPILNDLADEDDETVALALSNASNATLGAPTSAELTIVDDEPLPQIQFSATDYSVPEDQGSIDITVYFIASTERTVEVNYATSDNTAIAGSDYTATSGTLTFAPGETSKTFTVSILDDALDEGSETVDLTLSNPVNAAPGSPSVASLIITDDEGPPTVQFSQSNYNVDEDGGAASVLVTLSTPSGLAVAVDYATSDGSAIAGVDYTEISGTLTFNPGESSKSLNVPVLNDVLDEDNKTAALTLSNASNAILGTPDSAQLTILDDDPLPEVRFSATEYNVSEGGSIASITAFLNAPSGRMVEVDYATSDDTATAGSDYIATSGTLTFAPGETSKSFSVTALTDVLDEEDETVSLTLSNANNASLATPSSAQVVIIDGDLPPVVRFSSATYTVTEGAGVAAITVTLGAPSGRIVTLDYATSDGSATAGVDYTATSGSLSFTAGETSKAFSIPIIDNTVFKTEKILLLTLSNPGHVILGSPNEASLTILEDDPALVYLPLIGAH